MWVWQESVWLLARYTVRIGLDARVQSQMRRWRPVSWAALFAPVECMHLGSLGSSLPSTFGSWPVQLCKFLLTSPICSTTPKKSPQNLTPIRRSMTLPPSPTLTSSTSERPTSATTLKTRQQNLKEAKNKNRIPHSHSSLRAETSHRPTD